jgi:hypothetical protein
MSCASGCSGVPPMIGGGKKKRIIKKKLVKKGGVDLDLDLGNLNLRDLNLTDADIQAIFNGVPLRPKPVAYLIRPTRNNIVSLKKETYKNIDINDFLYLKNKIGDPINPINYDWTLKIINKDNNSITLSISKPVAPTSGGKVSVSSTMTFEEFEQLKIENIDKITIGNEEIFLKEYQDKDFVEVPFYILVIIKAIMSAISNNICSTEQCTDNGASLYNFVIKFLNSDLLKTHLTKLNEAKSGIDNATIAAQQAQRKAEQNARVRDLEALFVNLNRNAPPQEMPINADPIVLKNEFINNIKDKLNDFVSIGTQIYNSGPEIDVIIRIIRNTNLLNLPEKSALLSILNDILLEEAKQYMINKTRDNRYGGIFVIDNINLMEAKGDNTAAGYREAYNKMKGQLNLAGGKKKKKTRKVQKPKK